MRAHDFNSNIIREHLRDISFIHGGLKITYRDEEKGEVHELHNPGGVGDYLEKRVEDGKKTKKPKK